MQTIEDDTITEHTEDGHCLQVVASSTRGVRSSLSVEAINHMHQIDM